MNEELFESGHGVAGSTKSKVAADLGQQSLEPVSLTGSGPTFTPAALLETVGEAIADIGNGGFKAAPLVARASGSHQSGGGAAITAHK